MLVFLSILPLTADEAVSFYQAASDDRIKIYMEGKGESAGDVFTVKYSVEEPVDIIVNEGTVFVPQNEKYQKVIIDRDQKASLVPPGGKFTITGYCLDPYLSPPPLPENIKDKSELARYGVLPLYSSEKEYSIPISLIRTARLLYDNGKLHNDLGSKHLKTVTAWAIWYSATRNKADGWNKIRLISEITKQITEEGAKKTPEEIQVLTDNIWDDVNNIILYSKNLR